jgi:O-antigen/teichoic acid export membrane protein
VNRRGRSVDHAPEAEQVRTEVASAETADGAPNRAEAPREATRSTLTRRTVSGFAWTAIGTGGQSVLKLVILAVLARLVTPEEFGLVTVAMIAVNLSTILAESGIGQSIVQRPTLEAIHLRVGLTLSMFFATVFWAILAGTSGLIERGFDIDGVAPIVTVVSLSFVIRAMTLGDYVLFRDLAFRRVAVIEVVAYGLGYGAVAITMALQGFGAWAIVAGQLGAAALRTVLLWFLAPHPARPAFQWGVARELLSYGGGQTLARLANWLGRQGDNLVVGRFLGATALGLYGRAYELMTMPANLFGQITDRVLFPSIAKIQDDPNRMGRAYRRGVAVVGLLALPTSAFMAVVADEMIVVLLGDDWLALRAAFDILVLGILFRTSYKLSDALARATGAVYRRAWRQGVYAVAIVVGAFAGQVWGLTGVAVGVTLGITANFLLMAHLSLDLTDLTWRDLAAAHVPGLLVALVTAAAAWPAAVGLRSVDAPAIVILAGAGAAAAVVVLVLLRLTAPLGIDNAPAALIRDLRGVLGDRLARYVDVLVPAPRSATQPKDREPGSRPFRSLRRRS